MLFYIISQVEDDSVWQKGILNLLLKISLWDVKIYSSSLYIFAIKKQNSNYSQSPQIEAPLFETFKLEIL